MGKGVTGEWEKEKERGGDHEAELAPLVEEVAVDVDAVGLGEVF